MRKYALALCLFVIFGMFALQAQIPTATLSGIVRDALPACPGVYLCQAGGPIDAVPANINFASPFSSFDLRVRKKFQFGERFSLSLIGEGFNLANQVNIRGSNTANFSGRNISIGPYQPSAPVQTNFFSPASVAGGFFGSGGPRAFQFATRLDF
jgi:hypothetical protein